MSGLAENIEKQSVFGLAWVAKRLGISPFTLRRLADAGHVKTIYLGGRRMVRLEELVRIETYGCGGRKNRAAK
jgi:hypothetical protein